MKILDKRGYEPNLIEDTAPFTMEMSRHQKYGKQLKNSVDSYPLRDKIVLVMKDLAWVEQAVGDGGGDEGRESLLRAIFVVMVVVLPVPAPARMS